MWAGRKDCHAVISDSWNKEVVGSPLFMLKNLKIVLKTWNKEKFGDVHKNVDQAVQCLEEIQKQTSENGLNEELCLQEQEAQNALNKALHFQEEYWKEKSRIKWHCERG